MCRVLWARGLPWPPPQAQVCVGHLEQLCVQLTVLQGLSCTFTDSVFLPVMATWGQGLSWG